MIFLCFSSAERYSVVKSCLYHLKNYGYKTWYDYHELILGDRKQEKNFENAIQSCDYFVIIYSANLLKSPCAIKEVELIFSEAEKRKITIFPILYNITFFELPANFQNKIENLIYNEVTDNTGCLASINQIVVKMLLDEMNVSELDFTPHLSALQINEIHDLYLKNILNEYLNISKSNFNARISILFCAFKYIELLAQTCIPEHWYRTMTYLSSYTRMDVPYNHKELIIAELVIMNMLTLV